MKRAWLVVAFPVLVLSCTNASGEDRSSDRAPLPEDLPVCTEIFKDDAKVDPDTFGRACLDDTGELEVPRYADIACADGSTLMWNDRAWGYKTEPMHVFPPDAAMKIPTEQVLECQNGRGATSTTAAPG